MNISKNGDFSSLFSELSEFFTIYNLENKFSYLIETLITNSYMIIGDFFMNHVKDLSLLFFALFFYSCAQNNTTEPEPISGKYQFIGGIGTTRTYKETIISLKPYSNEPYYSVPDYLKNRLSLSSEELNSGISEIITITEITTPISDVNFNTRYNADLPKSDFVTVSGTGTVYSLADELNKLGNGSQYTQSGLRSDYDYQLTIDAILKPALASFASLNPTSTVVKNNMRVNDTWIREKYLDSTKNTVYEIKATVIGIETVNVEAGKFNAVKIKLTDNHYAGNYTLDFGYEYWVPNVGMVLKTSDLDQYSWNSATNKTIHYRAITRRELTSYNFVE
ncbi:MAG: hypothetical protein ACM3Q2_10460 [Syntrophothermus sp.]